MAGYGERMSAIDERVESAADPVGADLRAILDRQRLSFSDEGPPSVAVRRNRIDRLLALVLDNTDDFVEAIAADFGARPKTATLFTGRSV